MVVDIGTTGNRMMTTDTTDKPFMIDKRLVYEAYKAVKSNKGAAGVDGQSIEQFEEPDELAKLISAPGTCCLHSEEEWRRQDLGVPTVSDRIAQMVVKRLIEPDLDRIFLETSYDNRPNKSALDAVGVTRKRCWKYDWVLEFDIKGLFDNLPHDLLLKAIRKHVQCKWALLYIERWLTAPMEQDGQRIARDRGTPQGRVSVRFFQISSCITLLICGWNGHTPTSHGAGTRMMDWSIAGTSRKRRPSRRRFRRGWRNAGWKRTPTKTITVYLRMEKRKGRYPNVTFDFLGYQFRPRMVEKAQDGSLFCSFAPAASPSALKSVRAMIRDLNIVQWTHLSLADIAKKLNPLLRGWIGYYGRYAR